MSTTGGGLIRHRRRFWSPVAETGIPAQPGRTSARAAGVPGLRRRRAQDVPACARLLRVVHYEAPFPAKAMDAPRAWLCGDDVLDAWVVERQDEILGHIAISRVGRGSTSAYRWREMTGRDQSELAAVSRLFVRQKCREAGLGTAMLHTAVAEIRARGLLPVLEVAESHTDAVRLFEHCGWRLLSLEELGSRGEHQRVLCFAGPPA